MIIRPTQGFSGSVRLAGDKSISHRYAILGAMAEGTSRIGNYSDSEDCQATLKCLRALGVGVKSEGRRVEISSPGWQEWQAPSCDLDAGNSGTLMRLLAGPLAGSGFASRLVGDESLSGRPMRRIIRPLQRMGAEIDSREGGLPPLGIEGRRLKGLRYRPPVASAQVKSCVLLAGLLAEGVTEVIEEASTRDHTERALPHFGVEFSSREGVHRVEGPCRLSPVEMTIPGDFSGGVFFVVAALSVPGGRVELPGVGINASRSGLLRLLETSGAGVEQANPREFNGEPVCDLNVRYQAQVLRGFPQEIRGEWIPNVIDEIPALAVLGTQLEKGLAVRNAGELRKKETDRIQAVVENLRNLGVPAEEFEDGFRVPPGARLGGGRVRTYGDHRIAMAFAVAGLLSEGPVEIDDPDCAAVSFPDFYDNLNAMRA